MSRRARVSSGLVLLLVMLGLPVAPVLCELACPQAGSLDAAVTSPRQVLTSANRVAPCHESSASSSRSSTRDAAGSSNAASAAARTGGFDTAAHHGCDHPPVLTSPRTQKELRVPAPAAVAAETSQHLSPLAAAPALVATHAAARVSSRPPAAAFSPVLRI